MEWNPEIESNAATCIRICGYNLVRGAELFWIGLSCIGDSRRMLGGMELQLSMCSEPTLQDLQKAVGNIVPFSATIVHDGGGRSIKGAAKLLAMHDFTVHGYILTSLDLDIIDCIFVGS